MTRKYLSQFVIYCVLIILTLASAIGAENTFGASSEDVFTESYAEDFDAYQKDKLAINAENPSSGLPADLPADLSDEAIQKYIMDYIISLTGGDPANPDYTKLKDYKEQIKSTIDMAKLLALANGINPYAYPDVLAALDQFQAALASPDTTSQEIEASIKQVATAATTSGLAGKVAEVINEIRAAQIKAGDTVTVSGSKYVVLSAPAAFNFAAMTGTPSTTGTGSEGGTVALKTAKNVKSFKIPAMVKLSDGKIYKVTQVNAKAFTGKKIKIITVGKNVKKLAKNAFAKSKATKLILKTKLLKKATVKGSLKGSKVKTNQVKVGSKKVNKKFVKTYKKIFTKKNAGKKVAVK